MKTLCRVAALMLSTSLASTSAIAQAATEKKERRMGVAFTTGDGVSDLTPYRLALLWDMGKLAWREDPWHLNWVWEASAAYWDGKPGKDKGSDTMSVFSTGPIFRYQRSQAYQNGMQPYFEGGIGASWVSKRKIGGRKLGTHYQFEDRIGVGFRFGEEKQYDINYRLVHYSNASTHEDNAGINMQWLTLGYWFE